MSFDGTLDGLSRRCLDTLGVYQLYLDFFGLNCWLNDAKSRFYLMPGAQNLKSFTSEEVLVIDASILSMTRITWLVISTSFAIAYSDQGLPKLSVINDLI